MLVSFTVNNYRGFRALTVEPLDRINLISGMNNTGKTSLLEAVHLHENPLNPKLLLDLNLLRGTALDQHTAREVVRWSFHNHKPRLPIVLESRDDQDVSRTAEVAIARMRDDETIIEKPQGLGSETRLPASGRPTLIMRYKDSEGYNGKTHNFLTAKGLDHLFRRFFNLRGRFLETWPLSARDDIENFSHVKSSKRTIELIRPLTLLEPRLKNLSLVAFGGKPEIHGDIGLHRLVPFAFMGEGVKRLLSIVLAVANCPGETVLIDEVENGLHYSVMAKVWRAIAVAARLNDVQVFATTHSYECIRAAHEAFSSEDTYDLRLHRLERVGDDIRAVTYTQKTLETSLELNWEVR